MWAPGMIRSMPQKKYEHRALEDIKESIEELRYYKEHLWEIAAEGKEHNGVQVTANSGISEVTDNVKEITLSDEKGQ